MDIRTLCDLFYATVETHKKPDHLRYKKDGAWKDISSAEFRRSVEEVSLGLRELGLEGGERVAILSENRPEWAFTDLGALCAAAVDTPIYPTLPPDQVLYILNDSEARVAVVSSASQAAKIGEIRDRARHLQHVVMMDEPAAPGTLSFRELRAKGAKALAADPRAVRQRAAQVTPQDLATLIYTSGTTGMPKGVMLTHDNLVSNAIAVGKVFADLGPADLALSFLPLSHVFERLAGYYAMLLKGVSIAYAESIEQVAANMGEVRPTLMCAVPRLYEKMYTRIKDKVAADPALKRRIFGWALGVGREVFNHRVNHTEPGSFLRMKASLADKLVFSKIKERTGGRLRLFASGGAALPKEIAEFFGAAGMIICEGYGLTETSPIITVNRMDDLRPGTVGKALEGVEVKIAPDGEILTRGRHVMRGYFKKPEETAATIDPDGWLHTGDIGAFDERGFLAITDRKKDIIVTSGGKNLAPQPIESVLKTDPLIAEVVMIGNNRKFPSALVVPNFEALEVWAKAKGIAFRNRRELIERKDVADLYERTVNDLTQGLPQYERIKRLTLLPKEFTLESGELTPTLKVKRRVVEARYKDVIDRMYEGAA